MFSKVPTEIFLLVRSYLVIFDFFSDDSGQCRITRKETERSWRSFLAANKSHSSARKETMVWSLNKMSVKRYLENEQFRQYLNKESANPTQQLLFRYTPSPCIVANEFNLVIFRASNVGCLDIGFNTQLTELPSLLGLQALSLNWCQSLEQLGDYPNLNTLEIFDCPRLGNIGKLNRPRNLLLVSMATTCVLSAEQLLLQFPLEQIQKLFITYATESFFKLADRLTALTSLVIFLSKGLELRFPGELFPSLTTLETYDFPSVLLAGMTRLRNLKIGRTPSNQIFGKAVVYPQLNSFSHSSEPAEQDDRFLSLLKNVNRLSLGQSLAMLPSDFLLSSNIKVSSLDISMKGQDVIIPDRFFERMSLRSCKIGDSSSFANFQILDVINCPSITDIRPFKEITYLHLTDLPEVKDFSSLGSQRYLMICCCDGLSSEAVKGFGNVFHLHITRCNNVLEFKSLPRQE
jgi:hypothetical protein